MAIKVKKGDIWENCKKGSLWEVNTLCKGQNDTLIIISSVKNEWCCRVVTLKNFLKKYKKTVALKVLYSYNRNI